jgi:hypothetical protein
MLHRPTAPGSRGTDYTGIEPPRPPIARRTVSGKPPRRGAIGGRSDMHHITYKGIPSVKQFMHDSSIALAIRNQDKILVHLDWLLERYHVHEGRMNASLRRIVLCDIFLTANYWIKSCHEKRPNMKKERYPAVLALFEAAVATLSVLLQCSRPAVAAQIEEIYGRDLTPEGAKTDRSMHAEMFTEKQLAQSRIRFKGGRAYHYGLDPTGPLFLAPLDTAPFYTGVARKGTDGKMATTNEGWGPFVMTMEREFYMAKHWLDAAGHGNVFHSSYTHGLPVSAAGTMLVENGVIKGIRPDSGHYKPLEHNIVVALLALQMFSVPMDKIELQDYAGESYGTARDFVESRLNWEQFQAAGHLHKMQRLRAAPQTDPGSSYGLSALP